MSWKERSTVSLRHEFVTLALRPGANRRALCRRFGISPRTGYKWLARFREGGVVQLADRSRRPRHSPGRTKPAVEDAVVSMRRNHPAWGGRKIHARLKALGQPAVPAPSTITDILRRHGLIDPAESPKHRPFVRFEHPHPNDLWQMDFKGQFPVARGGWCFPLTVLDDHSRFAVGLRACANQTAETVQACLTDLFRCYGLPLRILTDNGSPWGCDGDHKYTILSAWLIRLGIGVSHSRPHHPQTQGKDERFHRTLQAEVLRGHTFRDHPHVQRHFDSWRDVYNLERPHEALDLATPARRYQVSPRPLPETLLPIEYGPDDIVRKVGPDGYFQYRRHTYKISQAFRGHPIALRPTTTDGLFDVFFCHQKVADIDLKGHTGA